MCNRLVVCTDMLPSVSSCKPRSFIIQETYIRYTCVLYCKQTIPHILRFPFSSEFGTLIIVQIIDIEEGSHTFFIGELHTETTKFVTLLCATTSFQIAHIARCIFTFQPDVHHVSIISHILLHQP